MKKILSVLMLVNLLHASETEVFEGRQGFHFGLGAVLMGGCTKKETWDDKGEHVIDATKECGAFPFLDLSIGHNISNQLGISLDMKTLIIGSFVGIKTKYYMQDARDTAFVSFTGGAIDVEGGHSGGVVNSYNNVEWGYAYGKQEFSIGAGALFGESGMVVHLGYKYVF